MNKQLELEDCSASPFDRVIADVLSAAPVPWPFSAAISRIKDILNGQERHRQEVMIRTCMEEIQRLNQRVAELERKQTPMEFGVRAESAVTLLVDATRKATATRSIERVKRLGLILARGVLEDKVDEDGVEEMMRVATELGEDDLIRLRELVRIEGDVVANSGRIARHDAHNLWERGSWGTVANPELDSVFSKLESYGLVSRIAPPNNLNIMADIQNRYALLPKGLRFSNLTSESN